MAHLRIRKQDIPIITFCIGIFVFPYILRERILGSLALINFLVYFGLIWENFGSTKLDAKSSCFFSKTKM